MLGKTTFPQCHMLVLLNGTNLNKLQQNINEYNHDLVCTGKNF